MDEMQFLGNVITSVITIGGFVAVIMRLIQPINELRLSIQRLNDHFDMIKTNTENHNKRIEKHGEEIDKLNDKVGKLETKMNIYHKE